MKKILLLLFFVSFTFAQNQGLKLTLLNSSPLKATAFLGYDNFNSYYFVENNVFTKNTTKESWQYKNPSLGEITKVDLQNPLKIVLFYENFNSVVLLDNQLNEIQKINFSENSIPIVAAAIGLSSGNKLWIYNSLSQQMGLFDYSRNDFQTLTSPFKGVLKYYQSNFNFFQWIDENQNWFRCDVYGKVNFVGKIKDFDQIQIIDDTHYIFEINKKMYLQDLKNNKNYPIEINEKSFENFSFQDQILSIFTNQQITNYKITIP